MTFMQKFCILCLALLLPTMVVASSASNKSFVFGVFPHISAAQIEKIFAPFTAHLTKEVGKKIHFRTKPTFNAFFYEIKNESYDIAFVQPFDYVKAHDQYNYVPLARRSAKLHGILVVRPDSKLNKISDLKGRKIGLPPKSAAVSHLVKLTLSDHGLRPSKDLHLSHYKSHDVCLNQLWLKKVDACGSALPPIRLFQKTWKVKFREIARTQPIPTAVFVVHKRVPEGEKEAIQKAILSWEHSQDGRNMLKKNKFTQFKSAKDSDYSLVREMSKKLSLE